MTTTTRHLVPVQISPALVRLVNAPGFSAETFTRSLNRARTVKAGYFRIEPLGKGRVLVNSGSHASYVVTRTSCQCDGHFYGGYCLHRAACVYCASEGIALNRETVLGFDADGRPVTDTDRIRHLANAS